MENESQRARGGSNRIGTATRARILALDSQGLSRKRIAATVGVAESTVRRYL